MIYVCYYRNANHQLCVRKISKGFACIREELPREIKTACRASNQPIWDLYYSDEAADTIIDHAVRELGYRNETPKPRYDACGRQKEYC